MFLELEDQEDSQLIQRIVLFELHIFQQDYRYPNKMKNLNTRIKLKE